uniref:Uncharacterized protein n=1 Tax=Leersia perrieri TaxID=77586 RepID=A0A0D9X948_9ORYZ
MPPPPWIPTDPTAGAPPPRAVPAAAYTSPWVRHLVKEAGAAVSNAQEPRARVPPAENFEVETREHEEKVNKYQAVLAARLKAKYFSSKAFGKEDMFEEMTIQSETILLSRSSKFLPGEELYESGQLFIFDKCLLYQAQSFISSW